MMGQQAAIRRTHLHQRRRLVGPEQAADMAAYQKFGQEHAAAIRGGAVLHRRPPPRRSG